MDAVEGVLDIGDAVPPFTLDSQVGEVDFEDIVDGKWCLLITVGAAFDPVATSPLPSMRPSEPRDTSLLGTKAFTDNKHPKKAANTTNDVIRPSNSAYGAHFLPWTFPKATLL